MRVTAVRKAFKETGIKLNPNEIELIDTLSGETRKNSYPNGNIVYNNTSLYLADILMEDASNLKGDSEIKRLHFFNLEEVPENLMDADLIKSYINYISRNKRKMIFPFLFVFDRIYVVIGSNINRLCESYRYLRHSHHIDKKLELFE